jgi:hypothetical protein
VGIARLLVASAHLRAVASEARVIVACIFWTFFLVLGNGHPDLEHPINFWVSRSTCEQARAVVTDAKHETTECEQRGFTTEELLEQAKDAMEKGQTR